MTTPSGPIRVSEWRIRWLFKKHRFIRRIRSGELTEKLKRDSHPSRTEAQEPYCTRTQQISYLDASSQEVARVHQYLRTDGTIGASGKPDPKRLQIGKNLYRLHKGEHAPTVAERALDFLYRTLLWLWHTTDPD